MEPNFFPKPRYNSCLEIANKKYCQLKPGYPGWSLDHLTECPKECKCHFPFSYQGKIYENCIYENSHLPWCSLYEDFNKQSWIYCLEKCSPNPCKNSGNCLNMGNTYKCVCKPGYSGENCSESS